MQAILWMQQWASPVLDVLAQGITILGEDTVALLFVAIFLWCVDKHFGYRLGCVLLLSGLLNGVLKNVFRVPRPWERNVPGYKPPLRVSTATGYSLPSGYTQTITTLCGMLMGRFRKRVFYVLGALLIILVGASRIYCRVHTLEDVITGFAFGLLALLAFPWVTDKLMRPDKPLMSLWLCVPAVLSMAIFHEGNVWKVAAMVCAMAVDFYLDARFIHFAVLKSEKHRVLGLLLGLGVAIALKEGLKLVLPEGIAADAFRYLLIGLWVGAGAPLAFGKLFKNNTINEDIKNEERDELA
jgi:membrane-associated phospholipid phosphatase